MIQTGSNVVQWWRQELDSEDAQGRYEGYENFSSVPRGLCRFGASGESKLKGQVS